MKEALYTMMLTTGTRAGIPATTLLAATPKAPIAMPAEPHISKGLRPSFSTVSTARRVNSRFTMPMKTVCTIGSPMPIDSKDARGEVEHGIDAHRLLEPTLSMMPTKITIQP